MMIWNLKCVFSWQCTRKLKNPISSHILHGCLKPNSTRIHITRFTGQFKFAIVYLWPFKLNGYVQYKVEHMYDFQKIVNSFNCFDIISKEIRITKERNETLDYIPFIKQHRRGRGFMIVEFTTTCVINAYHH